MDEYLFITWAKLKADRLKIQREQRVGATSPAEPRSLLPGHGAKRSPRASASARKHLWREQS